MEELQGRHLFFKEIFPLGFPLHKAAEIWLPQNCSLSSPEKGNSALDCV